MVSLAAKPGPIVVPTTLSLWSRQGWSHDLTRKHIMMNVEFYG